MAMNPAIQGLQGAYSTNNSNDLMTRGMQAWQHEQMVEQQGWDDGSLLAGSPRIPTGIAPESPQWAGYFQALQDQGVDKLATSAATKGMETPPSINPFGSQAGFFDTQGAMQGLQGAAPQPTSLTPAEGQQYPGLAKSPYARVTPNKIIPGGS